MAKSHHDVGLDFGSLKDSTGSRMSSLKHPSRPNGALLSNFWVVCAGISYRTTVARIVANEHTGQNELWITPRRYSSSTERHKGYFLSGYNKKIGGSVYVTTCVDDGLFRNDKMYAEYALSIVKATLAEVNLPRLREATRRGTIAACLHRLDVAIRNFSHDVPVPSAYVDTLKEMQEVQSYLRVVQAEPSIDAVRASVAGFLALEKH